MAYAGIRWVEVSTIIGFIVLQIVLIQKQNYTAAMIASVVYIPGAYFLKNFLYGSSAAIGVIKGNKYLNTLTNDRVLRGSPVRAADSTSIPTLRSVLRNPDAPRPNKTVAFTGIPKLHQNAPEQLTETMRQAGMSEAPAIFSLPPISVPSTIETPSPVFEVSTYDKALRQQQLDDAEAHRKQEMAAMSDRLAKKFSSFNKKLIHSTLIFHNVQYYQYA
ncbi:putative membrane protein [Emiliania huxleyi virus 18]|nr:putative membrane protein [Emiliania huxleyi virus 18]